ncbi:MAG: iron-sulfur cluster assembly protein [Phycisphaerales bacterium]
MTTDQPLRDRIVKALRTVFDPEIPVNLYDLGLIYNLDIDEGNAVRVTMTLTAPNCPVADDIVRSAERAVRAVEGVADVSVSLTFDPPWTAERMTEVAKIELEAMGIDPERPSDFHGPRSTRLTVGRKPTR